MPVLEPKRRCSAVGIFVYSAPTGEFMNTDGTLRVLAALPVRVADELRRVVYRLGRIVLEVERDRHRAHKRNWKSSERPLQRGWSRGSAAGDSIRRDDEDWRLGETGGGSTGRRCAQRAHEHALLVVPQPSCPGED